MITIEAAVLARAMKHAAGIVESRNTIPILANVRLTTRGAMLELLTSDLDIELRQSVPLAGAPGELACTVDARRLAALAGAVDAGAQIGLELVDRQLQVRAGRGRWKLPVLPVDDFPAMPFEEAGEPLVIAGDVLARAISRTAPSVGNEAHRPMLTGTLLDAEDGKLRLVSTDSHRLFAGAVSTPLAEGTGLIVPAKFMHNLQQLASAPKVAPEVRLFLAAGGKRLRAEIDTLVLTGNTIDSTFPEYRRVMPPVQDAPARFDPAVARSALRRVLLVATEKTRAVKMTFGDGKIVLSVTSPEGGSAEEEVVAECTAGHEAGFNGAYLETMLEQIGGDTIELHHADAGAPALFRRVVDDGARGVLMPMRV